MSRIVRLDDAGEFTAEQPVTTSAGVSDAGKVPVLGADGRLDASLITAGAGDRTYEHVQSVPSAVWVIPHGLGKYPSAVVFDSAGQEVLGERVHDSKNQMRIIFGSAFSGTATVN